MQKLLTGFCKLVYRNKVWFSVILSSIIRFDNFRKGDTVSYGFHEVAIYERGFSGSSMEILGFRALYYLPIYSRKIPGQLCLHINIQMLFH